MKKEGVLLLAVIFIQGAFALAGVSPASFEVRFEPNLEKNFTFEFIFEDGVSSNIVIEGEYSKYFHLNKNTIFGREKIIVNMVLPKEIEKPGDHLIRILANPQSQNEEGIGIKPEATGIIKLSVPYPGEYAETKLHISDFDLHEKVAHKLRVINRGDASLEIDPQIQVFFGESLIDTVRLEKKEISSFDFVDYSFYLDNVELPGKYAAVALVNYGNEDLAKDEVFFKIGENLLTIVNHTDKVKRGNFERFEVLVQSLSVHEIKDVYGEIKVGDESFTTNSYDILPFENKLFEFFLDSSNIKKSEAQILIHFGENFISKDFTLIASNIYEKLSLIGVIIAFFIIFLITWKRRR